jgi:hypothetical protein
MFLQVQGPLPYEDGDGVVIENYRPRKIPYTAPDGRWGLQEAHSAPGDFHGSVWTLIIEDYQWPFRSVLFRGAFVNVLPIQSVGHCCLKSPTRRRHCVVFYGSNACRDDQISPIRCLTPHAG